MLYIIRSVFQMYVTRKPGNKFLSNHMTCVFVEVLGTKSTAELGCGVIIVKYTHTHTHTHTNTQTTNNATFA
jgi:hypothetical protein